MKATFESAGREYSEHGNYTAPLHPIGDPTEHPSPLPLHIVDETNGLSYTLRGDYYFPDIEVPNKRYNFSRFGLTYFDYLKEHRPVLFSGMLLDGTLYEHIQMIDQQAKDRYDALMAGYIRCWNITEELKAQDQMKWVGLMNLAKAEAEHNIFTEIIYG